MRPLNRQVQKPSAAHLYLDKPTGPECQMAEREVETIGLEPTTPGLQSRCSPN